MLISRHTVSCRHPHSSRDTAIAWQAMVQTMANYTRAAAAAVVVATSSTTTTAIAVSASSNINNRAFNYTERNDASLYCDEDLVKEMAQDKLRVDISNVFNVFDDIDFDDPDVRDALNGVSKTTTSSSRHRTSTAVSSSPMSSS